jgi:hypothetical protein
MKRAFTLTLLLTTWVAAAYAQSDVLLIKRPAELRQAPGEHTPSVTALPLQTQVTRLTARQGAWIQVKTAAGLTGWVHMFDVGASSTPSAPANVAAGALRGLSNFFNRGSAQPTNTATSTVGIRGLTGEDIANAQPNMTALAQIEGMRQDASQARRFAADAALVARVIDPLPTPAAPFANNTPDSTTRTP